MPASNLEIECKFKVKHVDFKALTSKKIDIKQAYLSSTENIRVRIVNNTTAEMTFKRSLNGDKNSIVRVEHNIPLGLEYADELIKGFCNNVVLHKTRHIVELGDDVWEVDVFHGHYNGVVAEIEASSEEAVMAVAIHSWVGKDISDNDKYSNHRMYLDL